MHFLPWFSQASFRPFPRATSPGLSCYFLLEGGGDGVGPDLRGVAEVPAHRSLRRFATARSASWPAGLSGSSPTQPRPLRIKPAPGAAKPACHDVSVSADTAVVERTDRETESGVMIRCSNRCSLRSNSSSACQPLLSQYSGGQGSAARARPPPRSLASPSLVPRRGHCLGAPPL